MQSNSLWRNDGGFNLPQAGCGHNPHSLCCFYFGASWWRTVWQTETHVQKDEKNWAKAASSSEARLYTCSSEVGFRILDLAERRWPNHTESIWTCPISRLIVNQPLFSLVWSFSNDLVAVLLYQISNKSCGNVLSKRTSALGLKASRLAIRWNMRADSPCGIAFGT